MKNEILFCLSGSHLRAALGGGTGCELPKASSPGQVDCEFSLCFMVNRGLCRTVVVQRGVFCSHKSLCRAEPWPVLQILSILLTSLSLTQFNTFSLFFFEHFNFANLRAISLYKFSCLSGSRHCDLKSLSTPFLSSLSLSFSLSHLSNLYHESSTVLGVGIRIRVNSEVSDRVLVIKKFKFMEGK